MRIARLTCFILLTVSLFGIETDHSFGFLYSGIKYISSEKIEKSYFSGLALQTVIPKYSITEKKSQLGISFELVDILFYPESLSFDASFLTTSLHWYFSSSTILERESTYKLGLFANISITPFDDEPFDQYIGFTVVELYNFESLILGQLQVGYSFFEDEFYIMVNKDFCLTFFSLFTSAP